MAELSDWWGPIASPSDTVVPALNNNNLVCLCASSSASAELVGQHRDVVAKSEPHLSSRFSEGGLHGSIGASVGLPNATIRPESQLSATGGGQVEAVAWQR